MANKRYNIRFQFPKAKAAHAEPFASVVAANLGTAVNRAWNVVKKQKGIKGARIDEGKLTFYTEPLTTEEKEV